MISEDSHNRLYAHAAAILSMLFTGPQAAAAEIEEIIVTARKKATTEYVQDIPASVTAFTGTRVENLFAVDLADVGRLAPNTMLNAVGTFPGTSNFVIRGMGLFSSIPSDEPTVGTFVDGIYLGVNNGALGELFDVESVEILRGPQGTLFGRNVTGGAVLVNSRRPDDDDMLKASLTVGNYDTYQAGLVLNGSLFENFSGRIAARYRQHDGYRDNVAVPGDTIGETDSYLVRPSIAFRPNDDLDVTLITEFYRLENDGNPSRLLEDRVFGSAPVTDKGQLAHDFVADGFSEYQQAVLQIDWAIGGGLLTSVTGYRAAEVGGSVDVDGGASPIFNANDVLSDQDQLSTELRFATRLGDRSDITVGLYLFEQDVSYEERRELLGNSLILPGRGLLEHVSAAAFAQGDIAFGDSLVLTLGGRYTKEDKDVSVASLGNCSPDFASCTVDFEDGKSWDLLSGHAGLSWTMSDDIMAYGTWSRSYRSGGYNLRNSPPSVPGPYDDERVDAFELGFKSSWMERRAIANLAVFYNDYADLQRTVQGSGPTGIVQRQLNAADATISGFEAEVSAFLTEELRFDASYSFVDAEYDRFDGFDVTGDGQPDPDLTVLLDFPNVPSQVAYAGFTYDRVLQAGGIVTSQLWVTYADSQFADDANNLELPSYTLWNATLSYEFAGLPLRISAYGKNLTDEEFSNGGASINLFDTKWALGPRRQFGVEFTLTL